MVTGRSVFLWMILHGVRAEEGGVELPVVVSVVDVGSLSEPRIKSYILRGSP